MGRILVVGATGQDGSILSEKALSKGYEVLCPLRNPESQYSTLEYFHKLKAAGAKMIQSDVSVKENFRRLMKVYRPDAVCNFAAISNVFSPWESPSEVIKMNAVLPAMMLESILDISPATKFIQASSSLVFSSGESVECDESTPRSPALPYGISKNCIDILISEARETMSANACSAIFFNHESERRKPRFLTRKVILAAKDFYSGNRKQKLKLGNLDVSRDMGLARDFMDGIMLMIEEEQPNDYVLGTGKLTKIRDFVHDAFLYYNLDYKDFVEEDTALARKTAVKEVVANSQKAKSRLGWSSRVCSPKTLIEEEGNH